MNAGNKKKRAEEKKEKEKHRGWGWSKGAATPPTDAKVDEKVVPGEAKVAEEKTA